jgi:hypothetical protein
MQSAVFRNKLCFRNDPKKRSSWLGGTPEYRVVSFVLSGKSILSGEA